MKNRKIYKENKNSSNKGHFMHYLNHNSEEKKKISIVCFSAKKAKHKYTWLDIHT